jgi:hypothetical protein
VNIDIAKSHLQRFVKDMGCKSKLIAMKLEQHYGGDERRIRLSLEDLAPGDLHNLAEWLKQESKTVTVLLGALRKANTYVALKADPKGKAIKTLESLCSALKTLIAPSEHKWLFCERADGHVVPYFVAKLEFHESEHRHGYERPAYTSVSLAAVSRGSAKNDTVTWHRVDLDKGENVVELLEAKGYFLETPEAVARYEEDVALHRQYQGQTGEQFRAVGLASLCGERRWGANNIAMERDGQPAKVVMDDEVDVDDDNRSRGRNAENDGVISGGFWAVKGEDEDDEKYTVALPLHPYVQVFDLEKHNYVEIHVRNLAPYSYDKSLFDKLVLPVDVKDLIHILVSGSADQLDDIVQGKTGGTIIIATGPPGTGKTLTAEVFSETIEKPLYVVQCSQLGTDEEALEKHLREVLDRAARWKAILLIDEADVYVHERGNDVQQNAIVGVFLRVLEYYRGILFLTSNRATIIDDAIMSRATAWIRYELPTDEEAVRIWKILADQFCIVLTEETLRELRRQALGQLSGRNIKNLLKLAKRLATAKKTDKIDIDLLRSASRFLDLRVAEDDRKGGVVRKGGAVSGSEVFRKI